MEAPRQSSSLGPVASFWIINRKQNTLLWAPKKHGVPLLQCTRHLPRIIPNVPQPPIFFPEASTSEVRPFIPTDSEQNKGDDSEKGDNKEAVMSQITIGKVKKDKDRPERFIDLDVEMLNDIALWPTTLTDLMIDYIIRKKPNNIGLSFEKEVGQACRQRRRKNMFGETKEGHEFENRENFLVNSFYVICDRTSAELSRRAGIYETVIEHFFVFFDDRLPEIKMKAVQKLKDIYKDDIESFNFEDELDQFLLFLKENKDTMNTPIEI
ncbi:uncharacterized protein NPIL_502171 [Nephila pilipes]|uniref:Uncharacterized protein n=1 Tax=Nephila pilipes TaxID=299642 RepID=A0A8X6QNT3_NEPPI|nr:uncharacterized protein NPIL_502171 [Nephila pilipes]